MLDNSIAEINQHFSNANVLKRKKVFMLEQDLLNQQVFKHCLRNLTFFFFKKKESL